MRKCLVPGCKNFESKKKSGGKTFHRVPKNETRRTAWLKAIGLKILVVSRYALVCSDHFSKDCFDRTSACGIVRLRDNVIPNVFNNKTVYNHMDFGTNEESAIPTIEPNFLSDKSFTDENISVKVLNTCKQSSQTDKTLNDNRPNMKIQDVHSSNNSLGSSKICSIQECDSSKDVDFKDLDIPDIVTDIKQEILDQEVSAFIDNITVKEEHIESIDEPGCSYQFEPFSTYVKTELDTYDDNVDECTKTEKFVDIKADEECEQMENENNTEIDLKEPELIKSEEVDLEEEEESCSSHDSGAKKETNDLIETTYSVDVTHGSGRPMYKCCLCSYQTKRRTTLIRHSLKHKNIDEVTTYNCNKCNFRTKDKYYINKHMKRLKCFKEDKIYKCLECDYQTTRKFSLVKHGLKHRNVDEVVMFNCTECDFRTKHKYSLTQHIARHKSVGMYKCLECDFQTTYKCNLKKHSLGHKGVDEVAMHHCSECDYKTRHRSDLKIHSKRHKSADEVKIHKCSECDYRTAYKNVLKDHLLIHKSENETVKYSCIKCGFQTKRTQSFKRHISKVKCANYRPRAPSILSAVLGGTYPVIDTVQFV